jgi:hypothetical protein
MADASVVNFFDRKYLDEYKSNVLNPIKFKAGLLLYLPLASFTGVKITVLNNSSCDVTVPYKYMNKNPFNTTYWAVLGMAAEMASGALLQMYVYKRRPSVSIFVVGCEAKFVKRALGLTTFRCEQGLELAEKVMMTSQNFEAQEFDALTTAYNETGEVVAEFTFKWGIKARRSEKK